MPWGNYSTPPAGTTVATAGKEKVPLHPPIDEPMFTGETKPMSVGWRSWFTQFREWFSKQGQYQPNNWTLVGAGAPAIITADPEQPVFQWRKIGNLVYFNLSFETSGIVGLTSIAMNQLPYQGNTTWIPGVGFKGWYPVTMHYGVGGVYAAGPAWIRTDVGLPHSVYMLVPAGTTVVTCAGVYPTNY